MFSLKYTLTMERKKTVLASMQHTRVHLFREALDPRSLHATEAPQTGALTPASKWLLERVTIYK